MSRRNLETIVEAIRHLEGENALMKDESINRKERMEEDSDTSSNCSSSPCYHRELSPITHSSSMPAPTVSTVVCGVPNQFSTVAVQLLRPAMTEHYIRPAVIMQPAMSS